MKAWGFLLMLAGIGAIVYAFVMQTSVGVDSATAAAIPGFANGVSNMALMQQQIMILHVGLVVLLIGAIFYVAAELFDAMGPGEE